MDSITIEAHENCTNEGLIFDLDSLYAHFERIVDPRKPKGIRYRLATLLVLILLAKLGGQDRPTGIAEWLQHREAGLVALLKLSRKRVPHHCTYRRVLSELEPAWFEQVVGQYQRSRQPDEEEIVISIDGKTLRGTLVKREGRATHLLAAYLPGSGLVLMQMAVERKENEIVAAPKLLQSLDLKGTIVIGDAMHTQRKISAQIVQAGGDYLWTAKGNQAKTEWAIEKLFIQAVVNLKKGAPLSKEFQMAAEKTSKAHGRIEKRTILVSQSLNDYLDWPGVAQVFRLEREVWHDQGQRKTRDVVYGLTSLSPQRAGPKRLLKLTRAYWGIENGLHYRRDVTLQEDATRTTVGNLGHNLAILNNLVIALTLSHGHKYLPRARRLFDANPEKALHLILHA
jgi:predicted transposase YbfD/YdcC